MDWFKMLILYVFLKVFCLGLLEYFVLIKDYSGKFFFRILYDVFDL